MGCFSKWDIGGCGCGGCNVTFLTYCGTTGVPVAGVNVRVSHTGTGDQFVQGNTNSSGLVTLDVGAADFYDIVCGTGTDYFTEEDDVPLACGGTLNIDVCCNTTPCGLPRIGCHVSVSDGSTLNMGATNCSYARNGGTGNAWNADISGIPCVSYTFILGFVTYNYLDPPGCAAPPPGAVALTLTSSSCSPLNVVLTGGGYTFTITA